MSAKLGRATAEPKPVPVRPKDEVFVSIGGNVHAGVVVCHGKDGATVKVGDKHHSVPWHGVKGFKRRVPQALRIVDHGDDGAVVEEDGVRKFIAGLYPPGYKLPDGPDPAPKPRRRRSRSQSRMRRA